MGTADEKGTSQEMEFQQATANIQLFEVAVRSDAGLEN